MVKKTRVRRTVVQLVIDHITDAMISGELRPGDRIPTEVELSQELGISRNSVREAIKILEFMGVLEIRRPEGTFVSYGFSESMIDPMIYGVILNRQEDYHSIVELRELIEIGAAQLAMTKLTDEGKQKLTEALADLKREFFREPFVLEDAFRCDTHFHNVIIEIGDNLMVSKLNAIIMALTESVRREAVNRVLSTGKPDELFATHDEIYRMICERDLNNIHSLDFLIRRSYILEQKRISEPEPHETSDTTEISDPSGEA